MLFVSKQNFLEIKNSINFEQKISALMIFWPSATFHKIWTVYRFFVPYLGHLEILSKRINKEIVFSLVEAEFLSRKKGVKIILITE